PFVTLTFDQFSISRTHATLYARNIGASSALNVSVRLRTAANASSLPVGVQPEYRCNLLSPHGGQTMLVRHMPIDSLVGVHFKLSLRTSSVGRHGPPAAVVCERSEASFLRWAFTDEYFRGRNLTPRCTCRRASGSGRPTASRSPAAGERER